MTDFSSEPQFKLNDTVEKKDDSESQPGQCVSLSDWIGIGREERGIIYSTIPCWALLIIMTREVLKNTPREQTQRPSLLPELSWGWTFMPILFIPHKPRMILSQPLDTLLPLAFLG